MNTRLPRCHSTNLHTLTTLPYINLHPSGARFLLPADSSPLELYTHTHHIRHMPSEIHTHPERDTQTDRKQTQRDTEAYIQKDTQKKIDTQRDIDTYTERDTHRDIHLQGDSHAEAHKYRDTHTLSNNFKPAQSGKKNHIFLWDFTKMSHREHPSP